MISQSFEFHRKCFLLEKVNSIQENDYPRSCKQFMCQDIFVNFQGFILQITLENDFYKKKLNKRR